MKHLIRVIRASVFTAILLTASSPASLAKAKTVPAPSGWTDQTEGTARILTKGTARIEISGWTDFSGTSLDQVLRLAEKKVPAGASFISSGGIKAETVPGAWSVTRKLSMNGKTYNGVLYACPGESGHGRILSLVVERSKFGDMFSGGMFIEKVCKTEAKGSGSAMTASTAGTSSPSQSTGSTTATTPKPVASGITGRDLARENAKIPRSNRPKRAYTHLETEYQGFPVQIVYVGKMMMTFPNGWSTFCADWDLTSQSPAPNSIGREVEDCKLTKDVERDKTGLVSFKPGERVELALGNIGATGYDMAGSTSAAIHGGSVVLTKDGRIAIGEWGGFSVLAANAVAGGSRKEKPVTGRYYLNGYTITIETDEGEILHSFIGGKYKKGTRQLDFLHLAGKFYWNRDD